MLLIGCRQLVSSGGNKHGPWVGSGQDFSSAMEQSVAAGEPSIAVFADTSPNKFCISGLH